MKCDAFNCIGVMIAVWIVWEGVQCDAPTSKMLEVKQIVTFVHSGLNPITDEMCHSNYVEIVWAGQLN